MIYSKEKIEGRRIMAGTIFSLIIGLFLIFSPYPSEINPNPFLMSVTMISVATVFLLLLPLAYALGWGPLQQTEHHSSPHILEMFRKDRRIQLCGIWMVLFPLATYLFALVLISNVIKNNTILLAIWFVMLGITCDVVIHFMRRVYRYLNPFSSLEMFADEAKECIQDERELDLCDWIDAISEVTNKSIATGSTSLAFEGLNKLQQSARLFLVSSKSISHHEQDSQTKDVGITDKVSYTMFYLYQRLELIFHKALEKKLEPICSHIITIFGKIAIDAAKYDISMASPPLRNLGKLAIEAQDSKLNDVGLKASCILLEVAKVILTEIDITYLELQEPFLSIINSLEELAKGIFRQNKNMSIALLKQPFYDLKQLFATGKAATHQDTPIIVQNIDRVIGEFDALDLVLRTIPPIPQNFEFNTPETTDLPPGALPQNPDQSP